MVQPPCLVALQELKAFPGPEYQVQCLRRLKNDIVGHGQRKELVVKAGLLEPLKQILSSAAKATGKRTSQHVNGSAHASLPDTLSWEVEDEIRLQATLILASLGNAGPAFLDPILACDILPTLLAALAPGEVHPKIIVATLKALCSLSFACALLQLTVSHPSHHAFTAHIFSKASLGGLLAVLRQSPASPLAEQQIFFVARLIATCCTDYTSRGAINKAGILDVLAAHIAEYAKHDAHAMRKSRRPKPAALLNPLTLSSVLDASAAVVEDSPYRTNRLLFSAAMKEVFLPDERVADSSQPRLGATSQRRQSQRSADAGPIDQAVLDHLLPRLVVPKPGPLGSQSFPALATLTSSRFIPEHSVGDVTASAPLCVWLMYLARTQRLSSCRLSALRLLAIVHGALDKETIGLRLDTAVRSRERERQIALLAVPLAVILVEDTATLVLNPKVANANPREAMSIREQACGVLARLIGKSSELSRAAVEAGAIKHCARILTGSFQPVTLARPMWSAHSQPMNGSNGPASILGESGLPPEIAEAMKARAGALEALAAISHKEDTHRKAVIDTGVIAPLIDSLTPFTEQAVASGILDSKEGNTVPVLIAACHAASAMSRSVSLLRTSLIDAGIAKPVLALLKHSDNDVQVAATNVSINLVLDFSPMRQVSLSIPATQALLTLGQDLIDAGAIRTFCDHARRSNVELRLSSLWALKHLVLNAPKDMKIATLDELGTGWLIQAVSGDQRVEGQGGTPIGMSTPNAAGEQVDLLNAADPLDMDMDVSDEADDGYDEDDADDDGETLYDQSGTPYHSSNLRSTLQAPGSRTRLRSLRESEQDSRYHARQEDVEIQEQALDFIRNLINGEEAAAMVDHLSGTIGAQRIFELLHSKLKSTVVHAAATGQRGLSTQQTRTTWQPPAIIHSAIHILNHITAASSRHKQLLIAQKQLLTTWAPHFAHHDFRIRIMCVWVVINLTWVEDTSDREDARRRAQELKSVGIEDKVRALANDSEMDVRERVKTCIKQFDELLSPPAAAGTHR